MGLTDGLTFIVRYLLLASPGDTAAGQVIRRHLDRDLVTGENSDKIHPQLSGNVREDNVSVSDIYLKHGVGQGLYYRALELNYIVFSQSD